MDASTESKDISHVHLKNSKKAKTIRNIRKPQLESKLKSTRTQEALNVQVPNWKESSSDSTSSSSSSSFSAMNVDEHVMVVDMKIISDLNASSRKECKICGKLNHFAKVCKSRAPRMQRLAIEDWRLR